MKRRKFYLLLFLVVYINGIVAQNTNTNCTLKAAFSVNQSTQCFTNNQYIFTDSSTGGAAPFTYSWNLNDGTIANTKTVTHSYNVAGKYDISLIVTDANGCVSHANTQQVNIGAKPTASFNILNNTGSGNGITFVSTSTISNGSLNYYWNFGNGTTSTLISPGVIFTQGTYTVMLIATGNYGCSDTATKIIKVDANNNYCILPKADFSVNVSTQCLSANSYTFTNNNSEQGITYDWAFGDGITAASNATANHQYSVVATYPVSLTVTNTCGSNTSVKQITVIDKPEQPFAIKGTTSIMTGVNSQLTSATPGGKWAIDNNNIATINTTTGLLTGVTAGTAIVTYTVSNACGSAFTIVPITIATAVAPCVAPVADFSINASTQCFLNNSYSFTNTSKGDSAKCVWNFGDGSANASGNNVMHHYSVSGSYTVMLTAKNACGTNTKTTVVTIQPIATSTTTVSICKGTTYWFNGAAYNSAGTYTAYLTSYSGCDSLATLIVTEKKASSSVTYASICAGSNYQFNGTTYNIAGTYVAHLTNSVSCDSAATLVLTENLPSTSATTVNICAANLPYKWNQMTFNSGGTYIVHLTNSVGCDSVASLVLNVGNVPEPPSAIVGTSTMQPGVLYIFTSATPNGVWSSLNSAVATVNAVTGEVTAIAAGTTSIVYTTSTTCGSSSVSMVVTVAAVSASCKFSANFTVNNSSQCITDNQFIFTNTTSGGTAPYTYLWNLQDGTTATTAEVTKRYSTYGEHDITLKVTDSKGCESNAMPKHIIIGAKPVANFTALSNTGTATTFINASTIAAGSMSYAWDFGNGSTSTLTNPLVTFAPGAFKVKLTVNGTGSCAAETTQVIGEVVTNSVAIYPNPVGSSLRVTFKAASVTPTTIKIIDLIGRTIQIQTITPSSVGSNVTATFNTSKLMNGAYIISITDVLHGLIANQQILKQ